MLTWAEALVVTRHRKKVGRTGVSITLLGEYEVELHFPCCAAIKRIEASQSMASTEEPAETTTEMTGVLMLMENGKFGIHGDDGKDYEIPTELQWKCHQVIGWSIMDGKTIQ